MKALIIAHLYGFAVPHISDYQKICDKYNISLIEDNAQSFGQKYGDKLLGTFGDVSTYSFFSNKTIACGQGGAVVFKDKEIYTTAVTISNHGKVKDDFSAYGSNLSFNNLSAALLYGVLLKKDEIFKQREEIYQTYLHYIQDLDLPIEVYKEKDDGIRWVLVMKIIMDNFSNNMFIKLLSEKSIACRSGMNFLPSLSHFQNNSLSFTGQRPDEILLPIHTALKENHVVKILSTIQKIIQ
ncbi:MAG: DegT/DnrJ/EryC1/StrS family aminotransferase [Saprospiraceae bacterium]|nr:DegT/DnrJ/EryC1/StrS family aminotransferase [Saprospiraceae bacterium]